MEASSFAIAGRPIGPVESPYVIAEVSANHLGDYARAEAMVRASARAGVDAVKIQTFTPEGLTVRSDRPEFRIGGGTVWDGEHLIDLYERAMTPWSWTPLLQAVAEEEGIALFSSPFDHEAVDFLASLGVPAYKIASFELVDLPLIRRAAGEGRPLVMSTGMATVDEIDRAVHAAREAGCDDLALLRCNSGYPAVPEEMDLAAIPMMAERWGVPIGLSDHTLGPTTAVAAVALGASLIEKHVTLRRSDGGPDAAFSCEPEELAELVDAVHKARASLGTPRFGPSEREVASIALRRSLRFVRPVPEGSRLSEKDVRSVRPAGGLDPDELTAVVGRRVRRDMEVGEPLLWDDLDEA